MKHTRLLLVAVSLGSLPWVAFSGEQTTNAPAGHYRWDLVLRTTNQIRLLEQKAMNAWPAPGVYKTEPFTCLVLVPGKTLDDKGIVSPGPVAPAIPQVKPELRFIPRK